MNPNTVNEESAVAGSVSNQVVPANRLSPRSADVVAMHGETKALEAFMENEDGNGPKTIGYSLGVSTTVASHLIDAGRELHALNQRRDAAEESKQVVPANRYKGAVAVDSSDVTTFRSLRPGQWVRIDGPRRLSGSQASPNTERS